MCHYIRKRKEKSQQLNNINKRQTQIEEGWRIVVRDFFINLKKGQNEMPSVSQKV